jgi:release factor glutamine methyltransferase
MNYNAVLNEASKILKDYSIKSPKLDSEIILANVLKLSREQLLLNLNEKISSKDFKFFIKSIQRRRKKEPVAYIIGHKEFWKEKFKVNSNVLIPRPDTEIIVEEVLKNIPLKSSKNILDIGTGSGCIILSILRDRNKCYANALDISIKALKVAKHNAKIQQLENRIRFINSNIDKLCNGKYDIIISNPPYIKSLSVRKLDDDVRLYEPKLALDGGNDGFSQIREVIKKSSILIKKKGKLFLEISFDQVNETKKWQNNQNASKLIEKYSSLAQEALSNGDKILSENYFQHADHFARILGDRQVIKNANDENKIKETNGKKEPIKEKTLNSKEQNSSEN